MQKFYCYVDETGLDVRSKFFLVSVVIFGDERDTARDLLEQIEHDTGKGRVKWISSRDTARVAYIETVLGNSFFKRKLFYRLYPRVQDPLPRLIEATEIVLPSPSRKQIIKLL